MTNKTDRVQVRIDSATKTSVEAIFSKLGLSSGEAIRMFFSQVELNGGLPFPVQLPNATTIDAMEESENYVGSKHYNSFADIREELGV
jgi:DNA-damage-inducible protein J